jgi:site-specific DNA-methyltransferase (adenine-specific)
MYKLIHGDCLEVMKTIESGSIDAIITDPPYGTTACKWDSVIDFGLMWEQLNRIIKPNGAIVLFGSEPFSSALRMSNIKNYKYDWIWEKSISGNPMLAKRQPLRVSENINVFYKKQCTYNRQMIEAKGKIRDRRKENHHGSISENTVISVSKSGYADDYNPNLRSPKNILKYKSIRGLHPTQKPVPLLEYLIKTYTNENETVLDFTMGSGTTGVAAINLKRNFIGIEKDKNYFDIATKRIKEETIQIKLF